MPDPSPPAAIKQYLRLNKRRPNSAGLPVKIMVLGLSFLSETHMAAACLHSNKISGGYVYAGENSSQARRQDIAKIRENGGICSGYDRKEMMTFFPADLNKNLPPPKQNVGLCITDYSMVEYSDKSDPSSPTVQMCYRYTFNPGRWWKGDDMPCGWEWKDVDIVLSLLPARDFKTILFPRSNIKPEDLSYLKIIEVNSIYQGFLETKLNEASIRTGKKIVDHRARPNNCAEYDIHYRLPGVPDAAINVSENTEKEIICLF